MSFFSGLVNVGVRGRCVRWLVRSGDQNVLQTITGQVKLVDIRSEIVFMAGN